ncbi:hypothetical protein PHET_02964 [Paragonimus heterotremus]|uniref:Peptidase aspartic putative domain-containing protein n=1 Tax=Paragonimus heterotremus TaxID=100268 RepID=A0A8J4WTF4_9TREM|nr:hypothetical protein PHET_02964 [Paragonimus heterotremus]
MIPVIVVGPTKDVLTYAFLDKSSHTTLVSQELIDRLTLTRNLSELRVATIIGSQVMVALEIRSLDGGETVAVERAYSVPSLRMMPQVNSVQKEVDKWPHLEGIHFDEVPDKKVSILIGNDIFEAYWVLDQRLGGRKQPYSVKTLLGWIIFRPLWSYRRKLTAVNCLQVVDMSIAEQIQ